MVSIKENKEKFLSVFKAYVQREGIDNVIAMLEKTDFFTAPASTQYHDSVEGGLCYHSLRVYEELTDMTLLTGIPMESVAIVGLLHDVCKIGFYTVSSRNVKDASGRWNSVPYYTVDDKLPLGHGDKSVIMLLQLMKLTTDEIMAIRWHMGGFVAKEDYQTLSKAYGECPLALYTHLADMKATYLKKEDS